MTSAMDAKCVHALQILFFTQFGVYFPHLLWQVCSDSYRSVTGQQYVWWVRRNKRFHIGEVFHTVLDPKTGSNYSETPVPINP